MATSALLSSSAAPNLATVDELFRGFRAAASRGESIALSLLCKEKKFQWRSPCNDVFKGKCYSCQWYPSTGWQGRAGQDTHIQTSHIQTSHTFMLAILMFDQITLLTGFVITLVTSKPPSFILGLFVYSQITQHCGFMITLVTPISHSLMLGMFVLR
jgi:hypothetical protein